MWSVMASAQKSTWIEWEMDICIITLISCSRIMVAYKLLMLFKLANVEGMGPSNELLERSKRRSFVKFPISTGSCPEMLLSCRILSTFNRIDENVRLQKTHHHNKFWNASVHAYTKYIKKGCTCWKILIVFPRISISIYQQRCRKQPLWQTCWPILFILWILAFWV
jgi:hypothetical protein